MRNRISLTLAASAAAIALAGPAFAQDTEKAPFDGIYVSGTIGFDAQPNDAGSTVRFDRNLDGSFNDNVTTAAGLNAFAPSAAQPNAGFCKGAATSTGAIACRNDKDNISYSARIGFDKQYGNIVAGVVGEFGKSDIRDSTSAFSTTPASYTFTREIDYNASARLRLGYAANTTLFYGTGGVAYAKLDHSFETSNTANAFSSSGDDDAWGYVVGGGIEQKLGRNFSVGLEYLFTQYKDKDYTVRVSQGTAAATNPFVLAPNTTGTDLQRSDEKFSSNSVRAVASFRF